MTYTQSSPISNIQPNLKLPQTDHKNLLFPKYLFPVLLIILFIGLFSVEMYVFFRMKAPTPSPFSISDKQTLSVQVIKEPISDWSDMPKIYSIRIDADKVTLLPHMIAVVGNNIHATATQEGNIVTLLEEVGDSNIASSAMNAFTVSEVIDISGLGKGSYVFIVNRRSWRQASGKLSGTLVPGKWITETVLKDEITIGQPRWSEGPMTMDRERALFVEFVPPVLQLNKKGGTIKAYIELSANLDVNKILIGSVRLNDTVVPLPSPTEVGDYDNDGRKDLMVLFDKTQIINLFHVPGEHNIEVTGVVEGIQFTAIGTIRTSKE